MNRPTRATPQGRAYLDLQNRARKERRPTQELLVLYALERWLARLALSPHADTFVLKGGMLLAVLDARRPTADADLLARRTTGDEQTVVALVTDIAATALADDDGVRFLTDTVTSRVIREDALYAGVRVSMDCRIDRSTAKLKLDINVGDPITPAPEPIVLPSQRPGLPPVNLLGYPIETVLAEKITTAISLGDANTRDRDYADIYTLTGRHELDRHRMRNALRNTSRHRGIELVALSEVTANLGVLRQSRYRAFRARLGPDGQHLPTDFRALVAAATAFTDPLVSDHSGRPGHWNPATRQWTNPRQRSAEASTKDSPQ